MIIVAEKFKLKGFKAKDILLYVNKSKEREKAIRNTDLKRIDVSYDTNIKAEERHPKSQLMTVDKVTQLSENVKTFRLKRQDKKDPAFFIAGQYVTVIVNIEGKTIKRPVSLSSAPLDTIEGGFYEITIKKKEDGYFSTYVFDNWKVGDTVTLSGPHGHFCYEKLRDEKEVIAVAGGTGITPFVSMAKAIRDGDEDFFLNIIYCANTKKDLIFTEELEKIKRQTQKIDVHFILCDEKCDGCDFGIISSDIIKKYAGNDIFSLFVCGSQDMYDHLDKEAVKIPLDRKHYRKEIYGALSDPLAHTQYPGDSNMHTYKVTVNICGKTHTIDARSDETLTTSFERAGVITPVKCRGGICGYCRSRLIKGDVFIDPNTDSRRQADKVFRYIHPCVTFPLSDLVIDVPLG